MRMINFIAVAVLLLFTSSSFAQNTTRNSSVVISTLKEVRQSLIDKKYEQAYNVLNKIESYSIMQDSIELYKSIIDYYSVMDKIYNTMKGKQISLGIDIYNQFKNRTKDVKKLNSEFGGWIALYNFIPTVMDNHWFATAELADSISALSHKVVENEFKLNGKQYFLRGTLEDLVPVSNGTCGAYYTFSVPSNLPNNSVVKNVIDAVTDNMCNIIYFNTSGAVINKKYTQQEENPTYFLLIPQQNEKGEWGFVDKKGSEIIAFNYNDASFFSSGFAVIRQSKRVAYVDIFGNSTLELEWKK